MRNQAESQNGAKSGFLAMARMATLAAAIAVGSLNAPPFRAQSQAAQAPLGPAARPTFDVASIKANKSGDMRVMFRPEPGGRFDGPNMTPGMLVSLAYQLKPHQLVGAPGWMDSEHFDIEAKANGNPPFEQMRLMLQSLLADRFKLAVHNETRQLPMYALVLAKPGKTGPRLILHSGDSKCADISAGPPPPPVPGSGLPPTPCGGFLMGIGHLAAQRVKMEGLARSLGNMVDRIVVDQTGLSGDYDVDFDFTPLQSPLGLQPSPTPGASDPSAPPSIFTAVQEQLGLKLEPQTGPVEVLVIDHVEQPSEN